MDMVRTEGSAYLTSGEFVCTAVLCFLVFNQCCEANDICPGSEYEKHIFLLAPNLKLSNLTQKNVKNFWK